MMKLFKKKKSDNKLSTTMLQEQKSFEFSTAPTVNVALKKPVPFLPPNKQEPAARSSTPPTIIMPKPRRLLTPTRAILGRFDHDKTQVEEEEERSPPDMISPILLPTPHHEEEQFLQRAIAALPKKSSLQNVYTGSTVGSDESSRVYESALESLTDDDDDKISLNLPSLSFLKKQTVDNNNLSDISSRTASPQREQQRVAVRSPTSSTTITPPHNKDISRNSNLGNNRDIHQIRHIDQNKDIVQSQNNRQIHGNTQNQDNGQNRDNGQNQEYEQNQEYGQNRNNGQNQEYGQSQEHRQNRNNGKNQDNGKNRDIRQSQAISQVTKQDKNLNHPLQKQEKDIKYEELQQKVEMMEKQLALDREEFSKMEKELINHRHEMMETLIQTKEQLNSVLKTREENKAREVQYQQQLKQHQLQQLKQVSLQHQQGGLQQQQQNYEAEGIYENEDLSDSEYYIQQQKGQQILDDQQDKTYRRVVKSKSHEYIKYHNSRSSSRASIHNNQYYQQHPDEDRRSLSRRNSNNSNRSNILDPSPSNTIVVNPLPQPRRMSRPRSRSIEAGRFHEEHKLAIYNVADTQQYYSRPRRSRSVGRRPRSVAYYEDINNDPEYDDYYDDPRYCNQQDPYNNEYYMQPPPQQLYYNQYHPQQAPPTRQQAPSRYAPNGPRHYSNYHH